MNNDEEIFTKHFVESKPVSAEFNQDTINTNKKLLKEFLKHNLITETHHFDTNEIDKDNEKEYFENVIEGTLQNQNLYCSYLDYFDKMWMNNKSAKSKIF